MGSGIYRALNIIEGLILLFNSTVTPVILAYGLMGDSYKELMYSSIVTDFVYLLVMLCKFRTCYMTNEGVQEHNQRKLFLNYLTGWFLLDLVSVFPTEHLTHFQFDMSIVRVLNFGYAYDMTYVWLSNAILSSLNRLVEDFRPKFRRVINYIVLLHVLTCMWVYMNRMEGGSTLFDT